MGRRTVDLIFTAPGTDSSTLEVFEEYAPEETGGGREARKWRREGKQEWTGTGRDRWEEGEKGGGGERMEGGGKQGKQKKKWMKCTWGSYHSNKWLVSENPEEMALGALWWRQMNTGKWVHSWFHKELRVNILSNKVVSDKYSAGNCLLFVDSVKLRIPQQIESNLSLTKGDSI